MRGKERLEVDEVNCDGCEYYDSEDEYCRYLACDGLEEELPCERSRNDS